MAGHIAAIIGGKGGVGKSVFAANLAIAYLQDFKERPLIIDLDFRSLGDQNLILGHSNSKGIVDVSRIPAGSPINPSTLKPFMSNGPGGYSYIGAPTDAVSVGDFDLDGYSRFLKNILNTFKFVVVDCGSEVTPQAVKTFEYATVIFVVTTSDLIVINQTNRILSKIEELLFPREMAQVIINKYSQKSPISPQIIQRKLNRQFFSAIPEDSATAEACLAKSSPICVAAPSSQVARSYHELVRRIHQVQLLEKLAKLKKPQGVSAKVQAAPTVSNVSESAGKGGPGGRSKAAALDPWTALKLRIHKALVEKMDLKKMSTGGDDQREQAVLRERTHKAILEAINNEDTSAVLVNRSDKAQIIKEVIDEALALGPLEDLLSDDTVTEIMVNARDQIYVERSGKIQTSKVTFSSENQMMNVVDRILMPLGRRVDENQPYVDARLQDGSRVNIVIPPLALRGPTITIRKFPKHRFTVKDLLSKGTVSKEIADFLRICVEAQLNIIISGGTGTGKTTMLNVLSNFIPATERIVTIEDSAELQLGQEHVVRLESKPKNIEGEGEVSIRDLVKNSLRMRPDRIVVGECRDGAVLDMLQAMNTGHEGSLTTVHANNPRECIGRLETLALMAGLGLPSKAIKETIASAVDIFIQIQRMPDGSRKVSHISEITGMQGEVISLQDIFLYKQTGMDKRRKVLGHFEPTGFVPKFVDRLERKGMKISRTLFGKKAA